MLLPDGTILVHKDENGFTHAYDPVKAHEYYIRTRKLKGRKKGAAKEDPKKSKSAPQQADVAKKKAAWENFLKSLPLAQEGMALPEVEKFVQSLRGKSDIELKAEITKLKAEDAKSANPSPKGGLKAMTVEKILGQRHKSKVAPTGQKKLTPRERATQLKTVSRRISSLKAEIRDLERKLREQEAETRKSQTKAKKGPTQADKSKSAREAKKYRDKNQQKLKSRAKTGDTKKESAKKKDSVAALRDKIATAKGALEIQLLRQRELSKS
jgi:hypothetical protein